MTVPLRVVAEPPEELGHLEREAAAWENFEAAVRRDDKDEATRLYQIFAELHAQRPAAMVERIEREKGLR